MREFTYSIGDTADSKTPDRKRIAIIDRYRRTATMLTYADFR